MDANGVVMQAAALRRLWMRRNTAMQKWYRLIRLDNDLFQRNMESVISNDPRTGFDLARYLLAPKTFGFVVDAAGLSDAAINKAVAVQTYCDMQLERANRATANSLFGQFMWRQQGLMLSTGWYAIFCAPAEVGWDLVGWNPASCFPDYDSAGRLVRLARVYALSVDEAKRVIKREGWLPAALPAQGSVTVTHLFEEADSGLWHYVVVNQTLVRAARLDDQKFERLPIWTGPVAGLPDDGSIMGSDRWREEVGQSVVAPVLDVSKNYDKMLTFMQQLIRDTANPKYVEYTRGSVLTAYKLYERGAIFSAEPGEKIEAMQPPALPAEVRTHEFDLRGMIQRGTFSDMAFGNIQQAVSVFLMSSVTASARRVLHPFQQATLDVMSDIATETVSLMRRQGKPLEDSSFPRLPANLPLRFNYDIEIPGDFLQRAQSAKIINPEFKLSSATLVAMLFPEVKSWARERGQLSTEDALNLPETRLTQAIIALQSASREASDRHDGQTAAMLQQAAQLVQAKLQPGSPTPGSQDASQQPTDFLSMMRR
jgi:hypothetical protein